MCPTECETVLVAGPTDQQNSEQDTIVVLWGRGAEREVIESISHPHHLHSCPCHEREAMVAVPEMINCVDVSLFMYLLLLLLLLLLLSCIKYAINWN